MPYTYTLSTVIPASPAEVYDAWLDSIAHAEMTGGGEAVMSDEVGAEISALDGHITGRNLELVAPERIVQAWRTDEFDDETEDSIVTILLQVTEDGTLLTLEHSNVPDQYKSYEEGGWQSNYFDPMIAYFSEFEEDLVEPDQQPASLLESAPEAEDEPKPKDEPEDEDQEDDEDQDDDEDDEEDDDEDDEDDEADEDDEHRDHAEHDARPRAQRELRSQAEHKHESGPQPEVTAPRRAPARAATEAPGAGAQRASSRERRTGGSSARKAPPRAAANQRNAMSPVASVTGKAERPETSKKVATLATNKKAAKPAARKAAKPAARKAAKPAARKAAKPASKKKSAAKKKTAKPSATKKAAKKSTHGSAKRRSTKVAARGRARSSKAGRRKW